MPCRRLPITAAFASLTLAGSFGLCGLVHAQASTRTFLTADEIQKQVSGHKLIVTLAGGQSGRRDDFVSSGIVYSAAMQNQSFAGFRGRGDWKINADGALCVKRNSSDAPLCSYTFRDGDHWARTALPADDAAIISTFVIED